MGASARDGEANDAGANQEDQAPRGLAEMAFDMMITPITALRGTSNNGDGIFGSNPSNEISRLSLHYSSANMSEEESSSLINILDRKKYH